MLSFMATYRPKNTAIVSRKTENQVDVAQSSPSFADHHTQCQLLILTGFTLGEVIGMANEIQSN